MEKRANPDVTKHCIWVPSLNLLHSFLDTFVFRSCHFRGSCFRGFASLGSQGRSCLLQFQYFRFYFVEGGTFRFERQCSVSASFPTLGRPGEVHKPEKTTSGKVFLQCEKGQAKQFLFILLWSHVAHNTFCGEFPSSENIGKQNRKRDDVAQGKADCAELPGGVWGSKSCKQGQANCKRFVQSASQVCQTCILVTFKPFEVLRGPGGIVEPLWVHF